jgi:hypothetical protein
MTDNVTVVADLDRLEFRFRWDESEHRRMYRAIQRDVRRGSKTRLLLTIWFAILAVVPLVGLIRARDLASAIAASVPLVVIAAWIAFDRWGLSYFGARSYARAHALCIPHDQVRVLNSGSIEAHCTTSDVSVNWPGIVRVHETPEFFLFFTTRTCAIQLPKRAVPNLEQLRLWLSGHGVQKP